MAAGCCSRPTMPRQFICTLFADFMSGGWMHNQNCVGEKLQRPEMPPTRRTRERSCFSLHRMTSWPRYGEARSFGVGAAGGASQQASDRSSYKINFCRVPRDIYEYSDVSRTINTNTTTVVLLYRSSSVHARLHIHLRICHTIFV